MRSFSIGEDMSPQIQKAKVVLINRDEMYNQTHFVYTGSIEGKVVKA